MPLRAVARVPARGQVAQQIQPWEQMTYGAGVAKVFRRFILIQVFRRSPQLCLLNVSRGTVSGLCRVATGLLPKPPSALRQLSAGWRRIR